MSEKPFIKRRIKDIFCVTSLITVLSYELAPEYRNRGERHNFWEMVFLDRGRISCQADREEKQLRQGEIIFHKPNEFHSIACDGVHSASVFIVTFDCHSPAMKCFYNKTIKANTEHLRLIRRLIEESQKNYVLSQYPLTLREEAPLGGEQLIRHYLEELLILLLRSEQNHSTGEITAGALLERTLSTDICTYLQKNLCRRVTLQELSEHFHFGKSQLCDLFKKSQADTILNYHTKLKIMEAKRLLFEKHMSVSEISSYLGFESPAYFSRTFRRHTGLSPRAFQNALTADHTVYLEKELRLNS